ncbi:hypothetical protein MTR_8g078840 [Medicago truncatula]|uniref:Uncharacterized protein n=1 Tax=Medicago truncatula TaxID=3880 RepID=A0A072U3Q9_MEDTR|nr:hypothetical protein MTR_8g078840 [Medicago truncatula]
MPRGVHLHEILLTHWGEGSILKNLHFSRVESKKKFTGAKTKSALYYRDQKHY